MYGDKARNTSASLILGTNGVSRTLGRNHNNVNVSRRNDKTKVNVKAVCEHQSLAGGKVGENILLINTLLSFIGCKNHNDISLLRSLGSRHNSKTRFFRFLPALGAFIQANYYVYAALFEVERVSVTL